MLVHDRCLQAIKQGFAAKFLLVCCLRCTVRSAHWRLPPRQADGSPGNPARFVVPKVLGPIVRDVASKFPPSAVSAATLLSLQTKPSTSPATDSETFRIDDSGFDFAADSFVSVNITSEGDFYPQRQFPPAPSRKVGAA